MTNREASLAQNPALPVETYRSLGVSAWTDEELGRYVSRSLSVPRQAQTNSFTLHAPLEALARHRLLSFVDEPRLVCARVRLLGVATQMQAHSGPIPDPATETSAAGLPSRLDDHFADLASAIHKGALDDVDGLASTIGSTANPHDLARGLTDTVAAYTSAAGHAPIFLHLALLSSLGSDIAPMLRPLARELARFPEWRVQWVEGYESKDNASASLFAAMASTPQLGQPGSTFIFPVMSQVDPDPARGLLGQTDRHDVEASCRDITRAAALSMLAEPTKHAPYGWSHCLTMPQALCHLAPYSSDTQRLLAIAATHIVGFRAAFASMPLATSFDPCPVSAGWLDALDQSPDAAAAAVWHTHAPDREIVQELASRAAAHADTHLVKYTLACIDAAKADPESGRLYLAAAAKLCAVWSTEID